MISKEQLLLDELTIFYEESQKAKDLATLVSIIYKYTQKLLEYPLDQAYEKALQELKERFNVYEKLKKKAISSVEKVRKRMVAYVISLPPSQKQGLDITALNYPTKEDDASVIIRYRNVSLFLQKLWQLDPEQHKTFVKPLAIIENHKFIRLSFFPQYDDFCSEIEYRNRMKLTMEGYWFQVLFGLAILFDRDVYNEKNKQLTRLNEHVRNFSSAIRYKDLNNTLAPGKDNQHHNDDSDVVLYKHAMAATFPYLKNYLVNLMLRAQNNLAKPPTQTITTEIEDLDWSYNKAAGIFSYNGRKAHFRKFKHYEKKKGKDQRSAYGLPYKILSMLIIDDAKKKTRSWLTESLYEEIMGYNHKKKMGTTISDACKQINDTIQRECGLKNFLIYDAEYVRINTDYLP